MENTGEAKNRKNGQENSQIYWQGEYLTSEFTWSDWLHVRFYSIAKRKNIYHLKTNSHLKQRKPYWRISVLKVELNKNRTEVVLGKRVDLRGRL